MNKKLFHILEHACLIYLSKKEVTQELLLTLLWVQYRVKQESQYQPHQTRV